MTRSPATAVRTFVQRASWSVFSVALARALLLAALLLAAAQLALRLCGGHLLPTWHWSWLLVPVLAYAAWRVRRERLAPEVAAAHLDRRLGLGGLLLAAHAGNELDPAFTASLSRGLSRLSAVTPQPMWSRVLPVPLAASALATLLALLPPPRAASSDEPPVLATAQLEQLTVAVRDLFERGTLPEDVRQELEQRLGALRERAQAGQAPDWRDLDDLELRIAREARLQDLQRLAGQAGPVRAGNGGGTAEMPNAKQLAAAAKLLAESGMLEQLAPHLQDMLRNARLPDGSFDPALLALDPAALQEMFGKLGDLAGKLGPLAKQLDPKALRELQRLAQAFGEGGLGGGRGQGDGGQGGGREGQGLGGQGAGRGGVDRGPGHATLQLSEDSQGGASNSLRLPPGAPLPGDWVPVGSTTRPAQAAPVANTGAGSEAAAGAGGATWQLHLAPHHRAVVRRFFGTQGVAGEEKR